MLTLSLMKHAIHEKYFHRHAASIMFTVNYHFPPVESEEDPRVLGIADHLQRLRKEMQPGARLVEYFPWLRYVPSRCVVHLTVTLVLGSPSSCSAGLPSGNVTHSIGLSEIPSC